MVIQPGRRQRNNRVNPVCPNCGEVHTELSDILTNRPRTSFLCDKCEHDVQVEVHEEYSYTTWED